MANITGKAQPPRIHRSKQKMEIAPYLFILPALVIYVLFNLGPAFSAVILSFFKWNILAPTSEFVGFAHYTHVLQDSIFWKALQHNGVFLLLGVAVPVSVGFVLAVLIAETRTGRTLYRTLNFLPAIFSGVVVAYVWKWIYNPIVGVLTIGLKSIGLGFFAMSWLGDARIALFSVFAPYAWSIYGTSMVIFLAGLQNIDRELYDAADMDGANLLQKTFFITIPLLREVFTFEISLRILSALSIFSLIYIMTNGGPYYAAEVVGTYIYRNIGDLELGWATAAATINAIIVTVISLTFIRLMERK